MKTIELNDSEIVTLLRAISEMQLTITIGDVDDDEVLVLENDLEKLWSKLAPRVGISTERWKLILDEKLKLSNFKQLN
jgi:hypothetical protein